MDWDERVQSTHAQLWDEWFQRLRGTTGLELTTWISGFRNCPGNFIDSSFGSFNYCCRVNFSDGVDWMVRFTMPGRVMDGDAKVTHEVSAMRLIKDKTNIPVPNIHAWGTAEDNPLGLGPFIIMDYIEGVPLDHIWGDSPTPQDGLTLSHSISDREFRIIYRQIAGFLLDLAKLDFPRIGSFGTQSDGSTSVNSSPLTLKIQEIEAHGGIRVRDNKRTFSSTTEYFTYVADQDFEHLNKQPNSVDDANDARAKYQFRKELRALIPRLVTERYERGPFKLICDDMRPGNMLVNNSKELKIVALLDWEWAYSGPFQLLYSPPRWLLLQKPLNWTNPQGSDMARYTECFERFLTELKQEEDKRNHSQGTIEQEKLSELMQTSMKDGKFWFHELIYGCFQGADNLAWKSLQDLYSNEIDAVRVSEAELTGFAERKMHERGQYQAELDVDERATHCVE